jgi:hypothetical protein
MLVPFLTVSFSGKAKLTLLFQRKIPVLYEADEFAPERKVGVRRTRLENDQREKDCCSHGHTRNPIRPGPADHVNSAQSDLVIAALS